MDHKKYVTLSFDDGLEQDKRIIEILKQYGLKATFNLNSGLFGQRRKIGRMGDYGIFELPDEDGFSAKLLKAAPAHRIPEDEIGQVYAGFEIAAHGHHHDDLKNLHGAELNTAIGVDLTKLQRITGEKVKGFVYAKGNHTREAEKYLREHGISYGRLARTNGSFTLPQNPLCFAPTAWLIEKQISQLIRKFQQAEATDQDLLLSLWGHGYEFDFGTENCNWTRFEKLCQELAMLDNVVFCTNAEVFSRE